MRPGIVQLSSRADSTSEKMAATPKAINDLLTVVRALLPKRSFTTNDYIRIPDQPGGLVIQWLSVSRTVFSGFDTSVTLTLPTGFSSNYLFGIAGNLNPQLSTSSDGDAQVVGGNQGTITVRQGFIAQGQTLSDISVLCFGF